MNNITIRNLDENDCEVISKAFKQQGWNKTKEQYENYFKEQAKGKRDIIIVEYCNEFAGYITIVWNSSYSSYKERNIPEIMDFNVLIKQRRKHIGTILMDEAERRIKEKSKIAGLRVGLTADYGAAQVLYVKRGYVPDSFGIHYEDKKLNYGEQVLVDDELTLGFMKVLED